MRQSEFRPGLAVMRFPEAVGRLCQAAKHPKLRRFTETAYRSDFHGSLSKTDRNLKVIAAMEHRLL